MAEAGTRIRLDDAWSVPALVAAWRRLASRQERHAFDKRDLARLQSNPTAACGLLAAQIGAGQYRFQPLKAVAIGKPGGGERVLLVPPLTDRVVHAALAQTIADAVDATFHDASYAYRPGRGVAHACAHVGRILLQGFDWLLDADIRECFDRLLHSPIVEALKARGLWHDRAAWMLRAVLRAEVEAAPRAGFDAPCCLTRGLPQGSPLSPVLSNIALDALDHGLAGAGLEFVRYADDFVVFARDEEAAHRARDVAAAALQPLGLELSPDKTAIRRCTDGFSFLGQRFGTEEPLAAAAPVVPSAASAAAAPKQDAAARDAGGEPETPAETAPAGEQAHADLPSAEQAAPSLDPLLRTLYLLDAYTTLEREGDALVVRVEGKPPLKVPAARLHQVLAFGAATLTSGAVALCLERAIPVAILSGRGRYFGVIDPLRIDNLEVQRAQFRAFEDQALRLRVAAGFVAGKIANSLTMLRRWNRNHPLADAAEVFDQLRLARANASEAAGVSQLRGIEGAAAAAYWRALGKLIPDEWRFEGRRRNPPPDPVNSMLSYGYTVLYYNVLTLLVGRGLHPQLGFFHATRSGRHPLAFDMMEEFRAPIVDALVFDLVLNRKVRLEEFTWPEAPGESCLMSTGLRRGFIHAFERKMNGMLRHPRFRVLLDYRRIIDAQIMQLIGTLRGQVPQYLPYLHRP
jgi:CRISPR-associated protein Cas1